MAADLYFVFAKIAGLLLNPQALLTTALGLGFLLLLTRSGAFWGRRLIGLALFGYVAVAMFPLGELALGPLENRFPTKRNHAGPVAGIVVLGGVSDTGRTFERRQLDLNGNVERLVEFVRLARAHPDAKLVFAGGSGLMSDAKMTEAQAARRFFVEVGFDVERVQFEDRSRNTSESAAYTYGQFSPRPSDNWLLVTSARHMPRAMGLFRQAGWTPSAHPVDYWTSPGGPRDFWPQWPGNLGYANAAAYEWGALLVAWLRQSIATPFPAPMAPPAQ